MAVSSGERLIGVEWVLITMLQAGDAIASGGQKNAEGVTSPKLPSPSRFFAAMIAYLMLAGVALFGPNAAKVASRLGALAALAMMLAPPDLSKPIGQGNRPLIMRFLNLLNSYLIAGPITQPRQTPTQSQYAPVKGSSYSGPGYPIAANQNSPFSPGYQNQLQTPIPTGPGAGVPSGAAQGVSPGTPLSPQ